MALNLTEGTVIADRYRLERQIGEGGMGAVWLAYHIGLEVQCAVKFIHAEAASSADVRARFEREAKAAAQLRSPHVVQVLDNGVWEGSPYIAMEYLEGEDLSERLDRLGRLDARSTLEVIAQVGRALTKAHGAGLIHRDLKPANIFLCKDDDREIAKVLDFGIAKSNQAALGKSEGTKTKTGSLMGTPYYMSPEQAQGAKNIDHRTDLWALAVVVFQCLTGQLPFISDALGDLFMRIIVHPLPVPSTMAPVPAGFDAWWARAAARDPAERYQTAKELVDALATALGETKTDLVGSSTSEMSVAAARTSMASGAGSGSWPKGAAQSTRDAAVTVGADASLAPGLQTAAHMSTAISIGRTGTAGRSVVAAVGGLALVGGALFFALRPGAKDVGVGSEPAPLGSTPAATSSTSAPTIVPSAAAPVIAVASAPEPSASASVAPALSVAPLVAKPPPIKGKPPPGGKKWTPDF